MTGEDARNGRQGRAGAVGFVAFSGRHRNALTRPEGMRGGVLTQWLSLESDPADAFRAYLGPRRTVAAAEPGGKLYLSTTPCQTKNTVSPTAMVNNGRRVSALTATAASAPIS